MCVLIFGKQRVKKASNNQNCQTCDTHVTQPERGCAERLEFVLVKAAKLLVLVFAFK